MNLTKLDIYDYEILPGVIKIRVESTKDPTMVDILSDIDRSNGRIYVEGQYFLMAGSDIETQRHPGAPVYLNLHVTKMD